MTYFVDVFIFPPLKKYVYKVCIFVFMKITVKEYSNHTGFSLQRIGAMLRRNALPPGVIGFRKFGQTYVLEAVNDWKDVARPLGRYEHVEKVKVEDAQTNFL